MVSIKIYTLGEQTDFGMKQVILGSNSWQFLSPRVVNSFRVSFLSW